MLYLSGCFFSTAVGEIRSYENPKNKITAVPAQEEEIWGAKFMVRWSPSNYLDNYFLYVQENLSAQITVAYTGDH